MHKLGPNYYNHTDDDMNMRIRTNPFSVELYAPDHGAYVEIKLSEETEAKYLKLIDMVEKDERTKVHPDDPNLHQSAIHVRLPEEKIETDEDEIEPIEDYKTRMEAKLAKRAK